MLIELRTHERANLVKFVLIQLCVRSKGIYIVIYKKYNRNLFAQPLVFHNLYYTGVEVDTLHPNSGDRPTSIDDFTKDQVE